MAEKSLYELAKELEKKSEVKDIPASEETTEKPTAPQRSIGMDMLMGGLSGIGRGITGLIGAGGDVELLSRLASPKGRGVAEAAMPPEALSAMPYPSMARMIEQAEVKPTPPISAPTVLPTSQQVYSGFEKVLPEGTLTYKPQTASGRIAQMAGEFGSVGGLSRAPIKGALTYGGIGGLAGGASEYDPLLGLGVGIAGGGIAGIRSARRSPLESRMKEVVGEQTPQMLQQAQRLQQAGRDIGVPLTAAEAMDAPALRNLAGMVATTPEGRAAMSPVIASRKQQIPAAIEEGLLSVGARPQEPLLVGRKATEAAQDALARNFGERTAAVDDLYKSARNENVSSESMMGIINKIEDELKTSRSDVSKAALKQFLNEISTVKKVKIKDPDTGKVKVVDQRKPITKVGKLHEEQTQREQLSFVKADDTESIIAKQKAAAVRDLNKELGQIIKRENANIDAADTLYRQLSEEITRKIGDTGVKKIADAGGNPETIIKTITSPDDISKPISKIAETLNKEDKKAFLEVAKLFLYRAGSDAQKKSTIGEVPQSVGVKFSNALRGTPNKKANLSAVLDGVSKSKGHSPTQAKDFKDGFNKMLDVLQRTNLIERMGSPTQPLQEFAKDIRATAPFSARIAGIDISRPLRSFSEGRVDVYESMVYDRIANALVSDDAVGAVMDLAKVAPESRRLRGLVINILNPVREAGQTIENVYTAPTGEQYGITGGGTTASLLGE